MDHRGSKGVTNILDSEKGAKKFRKRLLVRLESDGETRLIWERSRLK